VEYQQIAAAGFFPAPSTDALECPGTVRGGLMRGLVFGTLLGPEATGPWRHWLGVPLRGSVPVVAVWDLCFWFPGCTDHTV